MLAVSICGAAAAAEAPLPPSRPSLLNLPLPPDVPAPSELLAGLPPPGGLPKNREVYLPIATEHARANGLPPEVADAVMRVESNYQPGAMGGVGERGLMQVLPSTAALLGFSGTTEELADPATNIRLGVRYLAGAWKLAGGDLCRTLMKYRAGHNQERMSALSVEYCRRAKVHLTAIGSPLGQGALPAAEFGTLASIGGAGGFALAGGGKARRVGGRVMAARRVTGRAFWAAHSARIKAIEARLPWKRGGIMAGG